MLSWDKKIERARRLSINDSPARELLGIYIKVAELQKKISHSFNGTEHTDVRSLVRFLPELKALVKDLHASPLEDAMAELGDDPERWSELLLEHWEQHGEMGSPSRAFLAQVLLQPYAQHVTQKMNTSTTDTSLSKCPACGNLPQLSVLREFNNAAKRSLVCSLCSTEWNFLRVLCPYCGEKHNDKLPVFTAEEFQQARIEGCDTCKSYIKCIDLSKDGFAVPQVDDLATLSLDLWAQEQGYVRVRPSMFLLPNT